MNPSLNQLLRAAATTISLATLLVLAGCSDGRLKTAPVKGTVTYNGKPVPQGSIMFQPEQGPVATANIKNGSYSLKTYRNDDGAILGKHKVTVISLEDQSGRLPEQRNPLPPPIVPLQYSFPDKSGLTAQVKDEPNTIDFHLK
jgi:hypothetical protein